MALFTCYLGFDLNHKYRVWHASTSPDNILNPVLEVERAGGRAFVIMPGTQQAELWGIINARSLNTRLIGEVENPEQELAIPKPFPNAFYSHENLACMNLKPGCFKNLVEAKHYPRSVPEISYIRQRGFPSSPLMTNGFKSGWTRIKDSRCCSEVTYEEPI